MRWTEFAFSRDWGLNTMLLVKAAMTEASKQTTLPKRMQLRNVLIGQSLVTAPLELPMDQQRWEIIALVIIFFIDWSRQETRPESRNSNCISGSTKCDRCAYRSSTQTFRGRSGHYRIERISFRSWNDDWKLSSSRQPPCFRVHVARRRNTIMAVALRRLTIT